jgi:hypothetical protein
MAINKFLDGDYSPVAIIQKLLIAMGGIIAMPVIFLEISPEKIDRTKNN